MRAFSRISRLSWKAMMSWALLALVPIPLVLVAVSLYVTEPLESQPSSASGATGSLDHTKHGDATTVDIRPRPLNSADGSDSHPDIAPDAPPVWPTSTLDGIEAKDLLLRTLLIAQEELHSREGYTATFRKQERIGNELRAAQTMRMKVRHEPFSIYLKFLEPKAGKEVVYHEGRYDNQMIAHNGDWSRMLVPRLKVAPTDPIALADNRHPITDAGLRNLVDKLVRFRQYDLTDLDAATILDRVTDAEDRTWYRSIHTHPHQKPERPFAHVEVLYDPESWIPHQITSYDWPEPGREGSELLLGEQYTYDDLDFDAELDDLDFDPSNPDYAFTRF